MKKTTMRAAIANAYGDPSVFSIEDIEIPSPKENEVLVRVQAASVTAADTMMRTGTPWFGRLILGLRKPKSPIPGTGFAGVVELVGPNVKRFSVGDRVFGETTIGFSTNAEYVSISEEGVILSMPENLSYAEACTFCDGPVTSQNFLHEIGDVQPGDKVLINGASGSLGSSAVQIAKHLGAEVTGVCSTRNIGFVSSLGADHVIDYSREDFTKSDIKYDVIYDTVGQSSFQNCESILSTHGKYLSPVLGWNVLIAMIKTSWSKTKKAVFEASGLNSDDKLRTVLDEVTEQFIAGKLKINIDRQYPLEKISEAHTYIDSGRKRGNVVLILNN